MIILINPNIDHILVKIEEFTQKQSNIPIEDKDLARFNLKNQLSRRLIDSSDKNLKKYGQKISLCGNRKQIDVKYDYLTDEIISIGYPIIYYCNNRICPRCQYRRATQWFGKFNRIIRRLIDHYSGYKLVGLNIALKNCHITNLSKEIDLINHAVRQLLARKWMKKTIKGTIKAIEITPGQDSDLECDTITTAHPHVHLLLLVPQNLNIGINFENKIRSYIRKSLDLDYEPRIQITRLSCNDDKFERASRSMFYIFKVQDFSQIDTRWLAEYLKQIEKKRLGTATGVFRSLFIETNTSDKSSRKINAADYKLLFVRKSDGQKYDFHTAYEIN